MRNADAKDAARLASYDLKLICENMLMSEGFQAARVLAIKFVTLYELSAELLSKQAHYDW